MKRVLGRDFFYLSRETRSNKTANGIHFPPVIIIIIWYFADMRKVLISLSLYHGRKEGRKEGYHSSGIAIKQLI
jgi:hypothetical protein